jgi:ABC-type bacteriocin/lantibiotic exporter with double-glycine peptidase domain
MIAVLPMANICCYLLIGFYFDWWSVLVVFGAFIVSTILQFTVGTKSKVFKLQDSKITDKRLKLVNDIVVGIRTIKCYGWENQYLKKIK